MPIIVPCPNCQGQLRVADDLIGRKVRCPACSSTFDAVEPPAPAPTPKPKPPERPRPAPAPPPAQKRHEPIPPRPSSPLEPGESVPTESLDPWKHLALELSPAKKEKPPERPTPGLRGAIEKESGPDGEPPAGSRRARLNDDHDDLRPCPSCGRMVHRDARRCAGCQARLGVDPDDDDDPRAGYAPPRRDSEPHRGGFILTMGIVGLVAGAACAPLSALAVIASVLAWTMGSSDLGKIRRGAMDREGESSTQAGYICGIVGTLLNALMIFGCSTCIGLWSFAMVEESKKMNRQQPFAPPPQKAPWDEKK